MNKGLAGAGASPQRLRLQSLGVMTLLVAYCSIVYELLLAQSLAIVLGQSFVRYTLTIGFYLFSLGMGALAVEFVPAPKRMALLVGSELALCALGLALPLLIFAGEAGLTRSLLQLGFDPQVGVGQALLWLYLHSWIFVIGLLSGCEVPILMEMAEKQAGPQAAQTILGIDYLGTFLGAVSFPVFTYHSLGLVAGAAVTAALNAIAALILLQRLGARAAGPAACAAYSLLAVALLLYLGAEPLGDRLMDLFLSPLAPAAP